MFDTNIVLDLATQRQGWFESFVSYDIASLAGCNLCFSVGATTDVAYLLTSSKYKLKHSDAVQQLKNISDMFDIVDVQPYDMDQALASKMPDYEDALLAYLASRHGCFIIISRNSKDFKESPVQVLTPEEFIDLYKPESYEYSEFNFS